MITLPEITLSASPTWATFWATTVSSSCPFQKAANGTKAQRGENLLVIRPLPWVGSDIQARRRWTASWTLWRASRARGSTWPRTANDSGEGIAEFLDWTLDLGSRYLRLQDGTGVELTTAEFDLLKAFVESPNRVLSRDFLLDQLHGLDLVGYERGIDVLVSRLSKKIQ